jgi:hypothetical protein
VVKGRPGQHDWNLKFIPIRRTEGEPMIRSRSKQIAVSPQTRVSNLDRQSLFHASNSVRGMTRFTFCEFFAGGGMARAGLGEPWRCLFANDSTR